MIQFFVSFALIGLALLLIVLRKTYEAVPSKELRRQAQAGDELAKVLYRAVAYKGSLQILLWSVTIIAISVSFIILSQTVPTPLVFVMEVLTISYAFVWVPRGDVTRFGLRLAIWCTPSVVWLLTHLYPLFRKLSHLTRHYQPAVQHTGIYERADLLALLEKQKAQPDNRLAPQELTLITHILEFSDKHVSDILIPKKSVRAVSEDDTVGPILMGELHSSGFDVFPVYSGEQEKIVGTLFLRDVVSAKEGGRIRDIMRPKVNYVHEEYPLGQMMHAFLKTKSQLFVVLNRFGEYVGIATVEDLIAQILGGKVESAFEQYDNPQAVVEHVSGTTSKHKPRKPASEEPQPTNL